MATPLSSPASSSSLANVTRQTSRQTAKTTRPWRTGASMPGYLGEALLENTQTLNSQAKDVGCCPKLGRACGNVRNGIWNVLVRITEPGNVSLLLMVCIACTGLVLRFNMYRDNHSSCSSNSFTQLSCYLLSAGLFGFIGGFTNWIAVTMMFTKIPFLYGSGVIPMRFKEIRLGLRREMISSIFDGHHFIQYVNQRASTAVSSADVPQQIATFMATPEVDGILQKKLNELYSEPVGQLLATVGIQPGDQSTLKPAIVGAAADLAPAVIMALGLLNKTPVQLFRRELDAFITQRVETLDQATVTNMLRTVLQPHLGWIVIWGSFFGMLTGIIVQAVGIAPQY